MKQKTKLELIKEGKQLSFFQLSISEVKGMGFKRFAYWSVCPWGQMRNQVSNTFFYHPEEKIILAKPGGFSLTQDSAYWRMLTTEDMRDYDDGNLGIEDHEIFKSIE